MDALFVSRKQTATVLGLSIRSVDYLITGKRCKVRRIGGRVLVPIAEVHRLSRTDLANIRPQVEVADAKS